MEKFKYQRYSLGFALAININNLIGNLKTCGRCILLKYITMYNIQILFIFFPNFFCTYSFCVGFYIITIFFFLPTEKKIKIVFLMAMAHFPWEMLMCSSLNPTERATYPLAKEEEEEKERLNEWDGVKWTTCKLNISCLPAWLVKE